MRSSTFFAVVVTSLLVACPAPPPGVDEEACEHLQSGPASAVTAVASGDGPLVAADHRRYDVTLVAVTGGNGGRVRFASDAAGELVIYLGESVPLTVTDASGAEVTAEASADSSEGCVEIKGRHVFDVAVGTYHLELGPTAATQVGIILEQELGGDEH